MQSCFHEQERGASLVLNRFRIFPPTSAVTVRPRLACEITVDGVVAARQQGALDSAAITAFAPLRAGLLLPGLASPNIPDRPPVVAALRQALDEVAARDRQLSLVIPDLAARVLLLEFDTLPDKAGEALPILRFRLRKLLPFDVEDAAISYQVIYKDSRQVRTVVAVIPRVVLLEYETAVREAGYLPGAVLPSTLATLAAVPDSTNALVISCSSASVTSAITRGNELLLYRTLDLPPAGNERDLELQQVVTVAMAYFEDSMASAPDALLYVGSGGASELRQLLNAEDGDAYGLAVSGEGTLLITDVPGGESFRERAQTVSRSPIEVRDLVPMPSTGAATSMPPGLLAGVVGALAN